jgi:excisionase family DNA binding protein
MSKNQSRNAPDDVLQCYGEAEAATLLSCSRRHLGNLRARGLIRFTRIGKRVVFRHRDLVALLDANSKGGWNAPGSADAA